MSIYNEFVKVQIDKARSISITLIYIPFYKLLIAKEAGLGLITQLIQTVKLIMLLRVR